MQTGWISGPWKPTNPAVTFTPAFHSLCPEILLHVAPSHGTVVAVLPVRHAKLLPVKNWPGRLTWVWLMATLNWRNLKTSGITTGIVIGSHPQAPAITSVNKAFRGVSMCLAFRRRLFSLKAVARIASAQFVALAFAGLSECGFSSIAFSELPVAGLTGQSLDSVRAVFKRSSIFAMISACWPATFWLSLKSIFRL